MQIKEILKTKSSRDNFLKGLIRIAKCDNNLDQNEMIFYQQAAVSLELEQKELERINGYWEDDELDIVFDTNKEKMFFFIQAIQLCCIDNHYDESEKQEIRKIAKEVSISLNAIEAVEAWVQEGIQWNHRGDGLLKLS